MKNELTRKILKSYLINSQVKFEYPITAISTPTKSMIVFINLKKLGEDEKDFRPSFGIIKTDILLHIIDMIDDPEIEMTDTDIIIKNDKITQKIRKSPANIFMNIRKESINLVEETFEIINEFELDENEFKNIINRAKLLGHDTLKIKKNKIITGKENGNELEDESETSIETKNDGEITLNTFDIFKIFLTDYTVKIYKNDDVKLVILYPKEFPEVKIIVAQKLEE